MKANMTGELGAFFSAALTKKRIIIFCAGIFLTAVLTTDSIFAQQLSPLEMAPPPLKFLSKDEIKQLGDETDLKKRTSLALNLMNSRIQKAEKFDAQSDFPNMYAELGGFHALMDYALNFLYHDTYGGKRNLSSFKTYELGLRSFPSRIELMRRELPIRYESYLRDLLKNIREVRGKAIEPFFSDTVIPNN